MIPVNEPLLGEKELEYVKECIVSGWVSSEGRFIREFETQWAQYCDRKHGIAVSNGTTALEAAMWSLNLEAGSEVIMPTFTIISCAGAILRSSCVPVLVDSDPDTWCMDIRQIEGKITPKTRAIMVVHIYGHPVDMDPVLDLARKYNLRIVEDAAEAHGALYKGRPCGSFGDVSCFSFYANKLITTGEGGMILTDSEEIAERARSYRNLCFRNDRRFFHSELGTNCRLTNMQAALGLAQVARMEEIVEKKRRIGARYNELLANCHHVQLPTEKEWARNVYWMYGIVLRNNSDLTADYLAKALALRAVQTRPFFLGMHEQPVFQRRGLFVGEHYPVADALARLGLYLPSGLAITDEQMQTVAKSVEECLA